MGFSDPVVWGSIVSVAIAAFIFVYLVFKIRSLMKKDADSHKQN